MNQAQVLIVEDDPVFAENLIHSLVSLGYSVTGWVTSGKDAIAYLAQTATDLVFVNVHLQGETDGISILGEIQTQYQIPTICLSESAYPAILQQVKQVSPWGYLIKPFTEEDIRAVVEVSLNQYQRVQQQPIQATPLLNEEQNDYVSMISHEFRTPLTSIRMATTILQEYEDHLSRDRKDRYFQQIHGAIQNLDGIIEDFLVMSQAEAGKLPIEPVPLNLPKFCQQLLTCYQGTHHHKHQFRLSIPETCQEIALDERRLRYFLNNLLSNAIKYSPQGGEVSLEVKASGNYVSFIVRDRGIGIPPADQAKLFRRFERASNVGKIRGIGLGLSIVKQIVEEQGGSIQIDSELGVGTTVKVTLPFLPVSHPESLG